jgi:hypothetical protein
MRRSYLTVYDSGTSGVWQYLRAESPEQIREKFPGLVILDEAPEWMSDEKRRDIEANKSYDVETAEIEDPVFMARIVGKP